MAAYYDETRKTWYCKFRYTDWTGKSRHTSKRGFRTKRDAKAWEHDFKAKAADSPDMTMAALCEKYLADAGKRARGSSIRVIRGIIGKYILPVLGGRKITGITRAAISDWQGWLLAQDSRNGGKISPRTARNINNRLSTILNFAVRMEYIEKNPAAAIPKVGENTRRMGFWEKSEYGRFIDAGRGDKGFEVFRLCFDTIFYGGLRIAEFYGLGKNSFDFQSGTMTLLHGMNPAGQKIPLKNKQSYRAIPMPPSIMVRIRAYMDTLDEIPEYGMFPHTEQTLRRRMAKWAAAAGLEYIGLHGLRHSHVSHLISLGVPITAISKRLGHKNPKITLETYSHMYEQDADILEQQMIVGQMLVTEEPNDG